MELLPLFHWEQLIVPSIHQVAPIYLDGFQILHTCSQLLRKDWADLQKRLCEKKSQSFPGRLHSVSTVYHVLWFLKWPLDNGVVARKIGHPLSANSTNIFSATLSQIPFGLSSLMEYNCFSEPGPMNDHCPIPNFFASTLAFAKHSSLLPFLSQEMSLNININKILAVEVSGVSPDLLSRSVTLPQSCNVENPGKMFHSNSVGSPLIPSESLYLLSVVIPSILSFQASLDSGCWWSLLRHNTESEKT